LNKTHTFCAGEHGSFAAHQLEIAHHEVSNACSAIAFKAAAARHPICADLTARGEGKGGVTEESFMVVTCAAADTACKVCKPVESLELFLNRSGSTLVPHALHRRPHLQI
jgi:hypothetical protein